MARKGVGRRAFLKRAAAGSVAAALPVAVDAAGGAAAPSPAAAESAQAARPVSAPAPQAARDGYAFLTATEAAFVEAAVDVFIPADELTPSGTDLGLAVFIDRQLAGAFGKGDRLYRDGPWRQGTPGQGYQLPLMPAEFFRAGLAGVNAYCKQTFGKEFDRIASADRQRVLEGLDRAQIALAGRIAGKPFFDLLYQLTMEGMFADPMYGGNHNKAAWTMIGYPGVIAVHATNITTYKNRRYVVPPLGIADVI